ncbi:MAG: hypothetical protein JAY75_21690 [Candidatus Thiodiazotropha taylori]|nr:hypothetical protein [Candidatus Thiodiazotropha taylori]MCW4263348.1 hypothetical protein [Candidatus Thiodiazotropha endolucinida]MCG8034915.1 hypothetical protein [Candidatus Thiodiazotropha taylori]MCG8049026.1 hypothetical protein [Candidatus Thiodiazotropha taylori]MCG8049030.1 hypothetical protein [Candidatus Thiodiazotropha taylori]
MGPKKVISKDDSALGTSGDRLEEVREKLLESYGEAENVRRRNAHLEIENSNLQSVLREKDVELKYMSDRMDTELQSVIHERDVMIQRMQDELETAQRKLAEARPATREVNQDEQRGNMEVHRNTPNVTSGQAQHAKGGHMDIPLPRQMIYDGKTPYEMFIRSFLALADTCGWDDRERAFRILNSLRGEAADFVFTQVDPRVQQSFYALEHALEGRFKERRSETSFLAELENRKLDPKEKVSEFVADIKRLVRKGYPTADERTFNKIALRHFIRGLCDQQMVLAVGMKDPKTVEDAQNILETYTSLRDESKPSGAVRSKAVRPNKNEFRFITESRLNERLSEMEDKITKTVDQKMEEVLALLKQQNTRVDESKGTKRRDMSTVECFKCHGMGHYARFCEAQAGNGNVQVQTAHVEENWD